MKHFREIAAALVIIMAGVAFSQQVHDDSTKSSKKVMKKSECCAKMKTKGTGKMSCCSSDSTAAKSDKPCCGNH